MKPLLLCSALCLLLPLSACEWAATGQDLAETATLSPSEAPHYFLGYPNVPGTDYTNIDTPEGREARMRVLSEGYEVMQLALRTMRSDATPVEKDRIVRQAFEAEMSAEARWLVESQLSLMMLDVLLPLGAEPVAAATPERVDPYVERLLRHENVNADRILAGLKQLEGHWSESQIVEAAATSAALATDHLARGCADCYSALPATEREPLDEREQAIVGALSELQDMENHRR